MIFTKQELRSVKAKPTDAPKVDKRIRRLRLLREANGKLTPAELQRMVKAKGHNVSVATIRRDLRVNGIPFVPPEPKKIKRKKGKDIII